jgi:hypothetical protein
VERVGDFTTLEEELLLSELCFLCCEAPAAEEEEEEEEEDVVQICARIGFWGFLVLEKSKQQQHKPQGPSDLLQVRMYGMYRSKREGERILKVKKKLFAGLHGNCVLTFLL